MKTKHSYSTYGRFVQTINKKTGVNMELKKRFIKTTFGVVIIFITLFFSGSIYAENIDPLNNSSQYAWGENVGWLNFEPILGAGVTVDDFEVTGYVWAENIGWINFDLTTQSDSGVVTLVVLESFTAVPGNKQVLLH